MRTRSFLIVALSLTILLGGAGALYAYDASRPDTIAQGITVGGVDIGGLSPAAARAKIRADYVSALQRPIVIHHDKSTWRLGAREAHIATDVDAIVDDAVKRSDEGNIFQRSWRRARGGEVTAELQPHVTFSERAVVRTVDRVRTSVNRKPVDARVEISAAGFKKVRGRDGLAIYDGGLREKITTALSSTTAKRTFVANTRHTAPKVSNAEVAKQYGTVLIVNKSTFTVKVYKDLKLSKTYPVAVGQPAYPTPEGTFHIQNKQIDPVWSVPNSPWAGELGGTTVQGGTAANPLKARWMGVTDGVGFHGTSDDGSIGSAASHGCMRMHVSDVIDLYPRVPVGATVVITH